MLANQETPVIHMALIRETALGNMVDHSANALLVVDAQACDLPA
jgi:lipoprotein signal peptidase